MLDKTLLILFAHCSQENASEFLKQIYDKYYKLVYFIAGKYLKRECDIEDVVIETFSSLYEERKKVKNLKSYLVTVSKNKAINLSKRRSYETMIDSEVLESLTYTSNNSYIDIVEKVYSYVDKLDGDIIIEHVVEGVPLKELSQKYQMPTNTLKSRYRRALKKLGECLGDMYE